MSFNKINKLFTFISTIGIFLMFLIHTSFIWYQSSKSMYYYQDKTGNNIVSHEFINNFDDANISGDLYENYVMFWSAKALVNNSYDKPLITDVANWFCTNFNIKKDFTFGTYEITQCAFGCCFYMILFLIIQCFLNILMFVPRLIIKFMHHLGGIDNE